LWWVSHHKGLFILEILNPSICSSCNIITKGGEKGINKIPLWSKCFYNNFPLRRQRMYKDSAEKMQKDLKAFKEELKALEEGYGAFGFKVNLRNKRQKQFHKDRIEATKSYIMLIKRKLRRCKNVD